MSRRVIAVNVLRSHQHSTQLFQAEMKAFKMIRLSGTAGSGISNLLHPPAGPELGPEIGTVFLLPLADYTLYELLMSDYASSTSDLFGTPSGA